MNPRIINLLEQSRQYSRAGRPETARETCEQALAIEPDNPAAHFELGMIALKQGQFDTAVGHFTRSVELDPGQWVSHRALGQAYSGLGNWPDAAGCYRRALQLEPGNPGLYTSLGEVLIRENDLPAAADALREALAINPDAPNVQHNLALMLHQSGNDEEAVTIFKQLAASQPDYPEVHYNLGVVLSRLEMFDEAIASYRQAIKRQPNSAVAWNNLGSLLTALNEPDEAITCYRKALLHQPHHAQAHSNLLMTLNYLPDITPDEAYGEALQFEAAQVGGFSPVQPEFSNTKDPRKILRIGYVSSDFRTHSVAHFIRKLIGAHNRDHAEVFCYANVLQADEITGEMQALSDHWVSIVGMQDEDVAEKIRNDRIDILVDLGGHTANNRLLVFALRPAPVQVTWLGYPNTTGMTCMDYRLTDAIADPAGSADRLHSEQLVRLPHGFLCFQSDQTEPAVSAPPCLQNGFITYGSFNNYPKITSNVIRVWSEILHRTPRSHLILKSRAMLDEKTRQRCSQQFAELGISANRVDLLGTTRTREEHLAAYARIDIGLDTFPYNGTTTTCEALWMGVPVISLYGDRHAGRVGASIMHHVGCPEFMAGDQDEYIDLAQRLASDPEELKALRDVLRPQMRQSTLMNLPLFTESLDNAFRQMWIAWCNPETLDRHA